MKAMVDKGADVSGGREAAALSLEYLGKDCGSDEADNEVVAEYRHQELRPCRCKSLFLSEVWSSCWACYSAGCGSSGFDVCQAVDAYLDGQP